MKIHLKKKNILFALFGIVVLGVQGENQEVQLKIDKWKISCLDSFVSKEQSANKEKKETK